MSAIDPRSPARVVRKVRGHATSDGAGVRLTRVIGGPELPDLDPFLLLDEFGSDEAADYIGGFPPHPHRGFETVTYMLEGRMRHRDHLGNSGLLGPGAVQWMTAGRGIIHSEMPEQQEGRMRGFQLWLNLPAAEKMKPANYRDIDAAEIPVVERAEAVIKVIAGRFADGETVVEGAVRGVTTDPLYLDVALRQRAGLTVPIADDYTTLVYVYDGAVAVGDRILQPKQLAVLGAGTSVRLEAQDEEARLLLLAAKPIGEPVVHYGPFVMNTMQEIEQALLDYRAGRLVG